MVQNLNQFGITPEAGDAVFSPVAPLNVRLKSDVVGNVVAGTFVKATGTVAEQIIVSPCAAGDNGFAVVKRNIRKTPYVANEIIGVHTAGSIVYIVADGAISAGDGVEVAAGGKVKTAGGENPVVGICLNAVSDGGLAMVQIIPSIAEIPAGDGDEVVGA